MIDNEKFMDIFSPDDAMLSIAKVEALKKIDPVRYENLVADLQPDIEQILSIYYNAKNQGSLTCR